MASDDQWGGLAMSNQLQPVMVSYGPVMDQPCTIMLNSSMSKVILMYSGELVIIENPYFVTTFIELFAIEHKIWQFIDLERDRKSVV